MEGGWWEDGSALVRRQTPVMGTHVHDGCLELADRLGIGSAVRVEPDTHNLVLAVRAEGPLPNFLLGSRLQRPRAPYLTIHKSRRNDSGIEEGTPLRLRLRLRVVRLRVWFVGHLRDYS